jgi:tetratricopeptide (TPR) repeat protein
LETIMAAFCRANLGLALQEQGRWAEALAEFELAQAAFADQQRATYFAIARLCPLPSYVAIGATERFDEALATSGRALDDANIGELDVARAATAAAELLDAADDPTRAARARALAEAHRARLGHPHR